MKLIKCVTVPAFSNVCIIVPIAQVKLEGSYTFKEISKSENDYVTFS